MAIEAESQAMQNIFTEHDFQDAFKKVGAVIMSGRGLLQERW
jgi:hypothetical protein